PQPRASGSTPRTRTACEPSSDPGTFASRSPQNPPGGSPSTPTSVRTSWRLSLHSPTESGGAPQVRRPSRTALSAGGVVQVDSGTLATVLVTTHEPGVSAVEHLQAEAGAAEAGGGVGVGA